MFVYFIQYEAFLTFCTDVELNYLKYINDSYYLMISSAEDDNVGKENNHPWAYQFTRILLLNQDLTLVKKNQGQRKEIFVM